MSASRFSSLRLSISEDDWETGDPSPVLLPTSSSSSTSGEFNSFVAVGTVAGGGGHRGLWFDKDLGQRCCLGKIGAGTPGKTVKFCIKMCEGTSRSCDVARHAHAKVKLVPHYGYIKFNDEMALLSPVLDTSTLSAAQLVGIKSKQFSVPEWERVLADIQNAEYPEWLTGFEAVKPEPTKPNSPNKPEIFSPRLIGDSGGIFSMAPSLSFDSDSGLSVGSNEDGAPGNNVQIVKTLKDYGLRFKKIKAAWTKPFMDIEANMLVLLKDLKVIQDSVGPAQVIHGKSFDSVWSALRGLSSSVEQLESNQDSLLDHLEVQISDAISQHNTVQNTSERVESMAARLEDCDAILTTFDRRFRTIKPVFDRVRQLLAVGGESLVGRAKSVETPGVNVEKLAEKVQRLEKLLAERDWAAAEEDPDRLCMVESMLRDQAARLDQIANRVTGVGVKMGNLVFPSFEDLMGWVKLNVSKGRFGVFVDAHSFLEFFAQGAHHSAESSAAAESHSDKAGYATYLETQMAASFKNLFPTVFGKGGSATLDDAECLPAITSGDKWDNGTTGVKHQLSRNMNDISYQLDSLIKKVLKDHLEARRLALDCVTASKRFVIDLLTFMSTEYVLWQQRGLTKKDAWLLVCRMARRIFEDMQSVRISARNIRDKEDVDFTTAMMLYASLKCHDVMESYTLQDFEHHPNISAVITRHLAANFVKPETGGEGKGLDRKLTGLASKVDGLESRIKNLESRRGDKH